MSSRMFQGVVLQMKDSVNRMVGVIDSDGYVVACSDLTIIGEHWSGVVEAVNRAENGVSYYEGKTLRFKGMVVKSPKLPPKTFLCGRYLMVCCEDDITFTGLACLWDKPLAFESKDWVTVTAKVALKFSPVYEKRGTVLQVIAVEPAKAPQQEVATFY